MIWSLNWIILGITGLVSFAFIVSLFNAQLLANLTIFLYYLRPTEKGDYPYPIILVGLIIAIFVLMFHKKPYNALKNRDRSDTKLFLIMQLYLLFNILLFNRWNLQELYMNYILPAVILYFLISEYIVSIKQIKIALLAIGTASLIICGDAVYVHFMYSPSTPIWQLYHFGDDYRLISIGWWNNPNALGYFSNIGLLSLFVIFTLSTTYKRYLYLVPCIVFLPTLFLTGSRGALLQLCISGFILFIREKKSAGKTILIAGIVFVIASYVTVLSPHREHAEGSKLERIDILYFAKDVFKAHPVFGVGFRMFPEYNPYGLVTHNIYAQLLSELGIVGTLLFFLMSKKMFKEVFLIGRYTIDKSEYSDMHKLSKGIFAISVGAFVYYFFGNALLDYVCCTILGLMVSVKRAYELESDEVFVQKEKTKYSY